MKISFKPDPAAALDRARANLASVEAEMAALQAERAERIAGADDFAVIEQIDLKLQDRKRVAAIHCERIAVLQAKQREQRRQEIEAVRLTVIEATKKRVAARRKLAADFETAAQKMAEALAAMLKFEDFLSEWPAELERPAAMNEYHILKSEVSYLLFDLDIPVPARPSRFSTPSIVAAVEAFADALIARMESAPIVNERLTA